MRRDRTKILGLAAFGILVGFLLGIWIGFRMLPAGGGAEAVSSLSINGDEYVTMVALAYAQTQELDKAVSRLEMVGSEPAGESVASAAARAIDAGRSKKEIGVLSLLANDLGVTESGLQPYLPTTTPLPIPSTNTPEIVISPPTATPPPATPEPPTPTPVPPTNTSIPDTPTPEPTPTSTPMPAPAVVAGSTINVRSGPSVAYPVVGSLESGRRMAITGRDQDSAWWQIDLGDGDLGWVADQVVDINGDTGGVLVITDIAPPPATATPSSPPTPTSPPKLGVDYVVKNVRLRAIGEHSQRCDSGDHNIYVTVVDAAGNRLDGVLVREIYTGATHATGSQGKGSGNAEWDIYRGGGGAMEVVDANGNRISEVTRDMSADWPAFDMLTAAGYCNCKPHPDDASCKADLESKRFFFAVGHYVYEVIFQRTY